MLKVRVTQVLVLIAFIGLWWAVAYYKLLSQFVLPGPYPVGVTLVELFTARGSSLIAGGLWPQLLVTVVEIAGAVGLSVVVGIPLGFLIGIKSTATDIYEPIVYLLYAIPGIVLYPIIYLMVGVGPFSRILFGTFLAVFVLMIYTIAGLRQVNAGYFRLSKSLKLSSTTVLMKVVLPAAAPQIVSGLRQCVALAILGVIAGEILASGQGLGYVISNASYHFQPQLMYAVIVLVMIIAFILIEIIKIVEGRFLLRVA